MKSFAQCVTPPFGRNSLWPAVVPVEQKKLRYIAGFALERCQTETKPLSTDVALNLHHQLIRSNFVRHVA